MSAGSQLSAFTESGKPRPRSAETTSAGALEVRFWEWFSGQPRNAWADGKAAGLAVPGRDSTSRKGKHFVAIQLTLKRHFVAVVAVIPSAAFGRSQNDARRVSP